MDNQQESSRLIALGWLAGIIDGEGCISLRKNNRKNQTFLIRPSITIVNTDNRIINKICEILDDYNLPYWKTQYEATKHWKSRYVIEVSGIKRCLKILPIIYPHLIGKQLQAKLIWDWCKSRLTVPRKYYSDADLGIVKQVSRLNKKGP